MTAGESKTQRPSRWKLSTGKASLLIVLGTFCCVILVRQLGWLQFLEFQSYDFFIQRQVPAATSDPIVLVEMTESDIQDATLDYPIHDSKLAEVLRILQAGGPAAIGLDIWRDIPVPKNGSGLPDLNTVLRTNENICAIFTLAGIRPPPELGFNPGRIAFNDNFPPDIGVDKTVPKVRRAMLYGSQAIDGKQENFVSLPFWLAVSFLEKKGIEVSGDETSLQLGKLRLRNLRSNEGAYVGADVSGFQMLIDFKCPPNFKRFSIIETLNGKIPPGALSNRIVIVGINAPSVSDERVTPVLHNHRGPELQAAVVNQLLRMASEGEEPIKAMSEWQEHLWLLFWCLVGGLIGYRVHSPWKFVFDSAFCFFVIATVAWLAFFRGWWIPLVAPALAYLPAAVLVTAYITAHERSMRAILMKLYSRHVSKEIAESIWANRESFLQGGRPLAQKLVVTVLFTDLKGFSSISEKMEPQQLYGWLNGYLGAMAEQVQKHGGVLKQFTGDGILALFGVPVPHPSREGQSDDAASAVQCALGMGRRMIELSKQWQEEGLPKVSMRAGIYTGEVAAGSVGSDDRFEYAVIGDVVNTASRLESYDKSLADPDLLPNRCRILIGEPTQALLDGKFVSKEIGLLEVKGKAKKVSVFQIFEQAAEPKTGI
jgi:adenylate cyclase